MTVPVGFRANLAVPAQCGGAPLSRVGEGEGGDADDGAEVWVSNTAGGDDGGVNYSSGGGVDGVSVVACVESAVGIGNGCRSDVLELHLTSGIFRVVASYSH